MNASTNFKFLTNEPAGKNQCDFSGDKMRLSWKRVSVILFLFVLNVQLFKQVTNVPHVQDESSKLWFDDRRIFFHETTGRNDLNGRQSCTIESAARNNPDRPVQIFLQSNQINESNIFVKVLRNYSNVHLFALNVSEYFTNTPLSEWYTEGKWKRSKYSREHFSDYIRMLSLHKGGGMYMDLDFITIKALNINKFWNFVPVQEGRYLTGSTLHLQHGHELIGLILERLAAHYNPSEWATHGPDLVNKAVRKYCQVQCNVRIFPSKVFYPIHYNDWYLYFRHNTSNYIWRQVKKAYAVHVWNKLSEQNRVIVGSNQIYSRLGN